MKLFASVSSDGFATNEGAVFYRLNCGDYLVEFMLRKFSILRLIPMIAESIGAYDLNHDATLFSALEYHPTGFTVDRHFLISNCSHLG
jgi:hypothetical protein